MGLSSLIQLSAGRANVLERFQKDKQPLRTQQQPCTHHTIFYGFLLFFEVSVCFGRLLLHRKSMLVHQSSALHNCARLTLLRITFLHDMSHNEATIITIRIHNRIAHHLHRAQKENYAYQHYLQLLLQPSGHVEVTRRSGACHLSLHVQHLGRGFGLLCGKQNLCRKAVLSNLNRIDGILANTITLLVKMQQLRIPKFLTGCDSLQI